MDYRLDYLVVAQDEIEDMFSKKDQRVITRKLSKIAAGIPDTLKLKTVTQLTGASLPEDNAEAFELRIGSGHRAAFVLYHDYRLMLVYMTGTHDYANRLFLEALETRDRSGYLPDRDR